MQQLAGHVTAAVGDGTEPRYWPIAHYGALGDCRTAALVAPNGSIDWCCLPHFDSPAVFLRLLDAQKGGYFQMRPAGQSQATMGYLPGTNILETTFTGSGGRLRLVDFMPVRKRKRNHPLLHELEEHLHLRQPTPLEVLERETGNDVAAAHRLARMATCLEGSVELALELKATFDYARRDANVELQMLPAGSAGAIVNAGERYLVLIARRVAGRGPEPVRLDLACGDDGVLRLRTTLHAGEGLWAAVNYARGRDEAETLLAALVTHSFPDDLNETRVFWRDWSGKCAYNGTYQYAILRSALALKLCTFEPTGAIVAAPTTSLPEDVGGVRNWDYRYTWLRDSAFTLGALGRLGYFGEARDYFHFLHDLQLSSGADIRIMYGIRGEKGEALAEHELDHLEGYRGSRPVRIGNGAAMQRQLDVYGELLDAAYGYEMQQGYQKRRGLPNRDLRTLARVVADYVAAHWRDLDRGIWEVRGEPRAFVYSRAMCWVALDRACRMAPGHGHHAEKERWDAARNEIAKDVLAHGYSAPLRSFVQYIGSDLLDAANLRLPMVDFLPWDDERIPATVETTARVLSSPTGLVYRYGPDHPRHTATGGGITSSDVNPSDGLPGKEGAFLACAFWMVEDLCHLGRIEEAREQFEKLLHFAGPLGLFSEEVDPESGDALGNYPQAFTHIGLVNAAVALEKAQEGRLLPHPGLHGK
ncbi:MAG TPA: glycoside hydrolase family 15 protein [Ktedonobacterales bacterium]